VDPATVGLIVFAEQMAALLAKTIVDIKNVLGGASTQTADQILADADATYQKIIDAAKNPPPAPAAG